MSGRIARAFADGRKAFIPYITAGDPDLETTGALVRALADAGADVIELGVPFSDPIADGPTNQRAAERALAAGTTPAAILELVRALREDGLDTAIVLFTYLNPLLALGPSMPERLGEAGVDGVLAVDLPVDEAAEHEAALARAAIDRIYLAAPSTSPERMQAMGRIGSGFLYCISRYGVTGTRSELPAGLADQVARARAAGGRPVVVGFGISRPDQAREVAALADGVVVGSAIVKLIEAHGRDSVPHVEAFCRDLADSVHGGTPCSS